MVREEGLIPPPKYPTLGLVTGKPEIEGDGVDTGGLVVGTALAIGLDAESSLRATVRPALGPLILYQLNK